MIFKVSEKDIEEMFQFADKDNDGKIREISPSKHTLQIIIIHTFVFQSIATQCSKLDAVVTSPSATLSSKPWSHHPSCWWRSRGPRPRPPTWRGSPSWAARSRSQCPSPTSCAELRLPFYPIPFPFSFPETEHYTLGSRLFGKSSYFVTVIKSRASFTQLETMHMDFLL